MSDLKRLLERSLREKEPDDFVNLPAKVEEFIRENKVDETAGKQLRVADPKVQKEVIHRGGLLECKNPSAVCLARIREEKKLLGDTPSVHPALPALPAMTAMPTLPAMAAAQHQQVMMANMGSQMTMMQTMTGMPSIPGMVGVGSVPGMPGAVSVPGIFGMGGMVSMGMTSTPPIAGMPGMANMPCMIGMPGMPSIGSAAPVLAGMASPPMMMQTVVAGTAPAFQVAATGSTHTPIQVACATTDPILGSMSPSIGAGVGVCAPVTGQESLAAAMVSGCSGQPMVSYGAVRADGSLQRTMPY